MLIEIFFKVEYNSIKGNVIKSLNGILNTVMPISLAALYNSPIQSLYCKTGEFLLYYKGYLQLIKKYFLNASKQNSKQQDL